MPQCKTKTKTNQNTTVLPRCLQDNTVLCPGCNFLPLSPPTHPPSWQVPRRATLSLLRAVPSLSLQWLPTLLAGACGIRMGEATGVSWSGGGWVYVCVRVRVPLWLSDNELIRKKAMLCLYLCQSRKPGRVQQWYWRPTLLGTHLTQENVPKHSHLAYLTATNYRRKQESPSSSCYEWGHWGTGTVLSWLGWAFNCILILLTGMQVIY